MKKLLIAASISLLSGIANATSIVPPTLVYEDTETIWFDVTDDFLVTCHADGTVCRRNIATGKIISHFTIAANDETFYVKHTFRMGHPHLFISYNHKPVIAYIESEYRCPPPKDDPNAISYCTLISFYDLLTGKKISTSVNKSRSVDRLRSIGLSEDGKKFFLSIKKSSEAIMRAPISKMKSFKEVVKFFESIEGHDMPKELLLCISVETGKVLWQVEQSRKGFYHPIFIPTTEGYVTFSGDQVLSANKQGQILWEKKFDRHSYPIYIPPSGPTGQLYSTWYSVRNKKLLTVSLLDGEKLWHRSNVTSDKLLAVTRDGKRQAFYFDRFPFGNLLQITSLPAKETITIKAIKKKCDAVFTKDSKKLYCLSSLKVVGKDRWKNTRTYARKSNIMKIIDCETGEISQFELKKP